MKEALDFRVQLQNLPTIIGVGLGLATKHLKQSGLEGIVPSCAETARVVIKSKDRSYLFFL